LGAAGKNGWKTRGNKVSPARAGHNSSYDDRRLRLAGTIRDNGLLPSETEEKTTGQRFERLVEIMARLRAPGGCPWDREQTFDTIKPYLLEESYEVMDAIDRRDWPGLREELGDLLLQSVFFAQMASEQGSFRIDDSIDSIVEKLIRRHPHVFGSGKADTPDAVKKRWDEIKAEEKRQRGEKERTLLEGVPRALPALVEAQQIAQKAAKVGFDWPDIEDVFAKLEEELAELHDARASAAQQEIESEIGDLLFVVVNLARFLSVDAEQALRRTNSKFRHRFGHVEKSLAESGTPLEHASLEQMESLWQEAKTKS
jgi:MazG family protein